MNEKQQRQIKKIVSKILRKNHNVIDFSRSFQENGMDSIGFIELIILIEEKFHIEFPDKLLSINQINSLSKLADEVDRLLKEASK